MFENITFFTFERKPKTDVMFWMRIGLWMKTVMFLILRPHWLVEEKRDGCEFCNIIALWKEEHVLCFEFYNILACKRKKRKNLMLWRNATSLLCRQKNRDVFDKTPMVFFFISKIDICDKWKQHHAKLKYGFFFLLIFYHLSAQNMVMFLTWQIWKTWCFIVILWKKCHLSRSEFEQKIKFVLFWRKSQSFRKVFRSKCDDFYCKNHDVFDTAIRFFPFKTLPFYHKF